MQESLDDETIQLTLQLDEPGTSYYYSYNAYYMCV